MKQIIAIDIGAYLTKVTIAEPKGKTLEVSVLKHFLTPYQKEDTFDEESFFEQLFAIVPQAELKVAQVAIGLPSTTTNFSFFDMPPIARSDLKQAITSEAQRTIRPTPAEGDIVRYVIFKNPKAKESRQVNVLAGAGIEADVMRYCSMFQQQGIVPGFIASSASSLMVYPLGYYPQLPENWCFIDIGYTDTKIVIFSAEMPTLVRTIMFATRDFVQAIATEKKIDFQDAHRLFLKQEAPEVVNNSWGYLISEIRRSFAYYKEISAGKAIEGVYFTGGIFSVGPYIDILKKNIGGKVEFLDLASVNNLSLEGADPEQRASASYFFVTSIGLILSYFQQKQVLNFLPSTVLKEKQTQVIQSLAQQALKLVAGGLIVLLLLLLFRASVSKGNLSKEAKTFSEEKYQSVMAAAKEMSDLEDKVKTQEDFIAGETEVNQSRREALAVIAKYIPTNAYLASTEITASTASADQGSGRGRRGRRAKKAASEEGESFKCNGWIQATYEDSIDQLRIFVKKLSKSEIFKEVSLAKRPALEDEPFQPYASDFTMNVRRKFELELKLK